MSLESTALVWAHSKADGAALLAILCIADHDGDGGSWPSMETIAHRARVTRDTARKLVRKLEAMGEIVTDTNGGGGLRTASHMRTNRYEITIECPPTCDHSARHRERPEPVDNTPQPNGGVPSARRGAPQPHGGANHPLTTHLGNSELDLGDLGGDDRVSKSESEGQADYGSWHPGAQVAEAMRQAAVDADRQPVKRPDYSKPATGLKVAPPAPTVPRFDPATIPARPELVSAEQQQFNAEAELFACPDGFGTGKGSRHWCPPVEAACARCGADVADILNLDNLEPQP